jgi:hypothetical protein
MRSSATQTRNFLKRSLKVSLLRKYTKALTFQNVWQELATHISAYQAHILKSSLCRAVTKV